MCIMTMVERGAELNAERLRHPGGDDSWDDPINIEIFSERI